MLVTKREIEQILSARTRLRELCLPVRRGEFGEMKRCPVRVGGVYRLKGRVAYDTYKANATANCPTRARAVVWLMAQCMDEKRLEATITVREVVQKDETWHVRFVKDTATLLDQDIYLAKYGDYTTMASRQAVPGDPPAVILKGAGEQARVLALTTKMAAQVALITGASHRIGALRESMVTMKSQTRTRAQLIERELEKLKAEMSVAGCGSFTVSDCTAMPSGPQAERVSGTGASSALRP